MKKFVTTLLALTCGVSFSQELTEVDRQLLLERLDDIQKSADSAARNRFSAAISAYRAAAASDVAANELWLKCWEKVDFQDEAKSAKISVRSARSTKIKEIAQASVVRCAIS
ncbi:hypothetical protein N9881_00740 [bacterium]|nr:hypothetical protein [bacterium]